MVRTESDSWDLATSVGATATMVAAGPDPLIDDPFAAPLVRAVASTSIPGWWTGRFPSEKTPNSIPSGWPRAWPFAPGSTTTFSSTPRTAVFVRRSSWRPAWTHGPIGYRGPPDTFVYEVELPEVIEFKTATLGKLGAEPRAERRTVGADVRDDWHAALRSAGFDPHAAATWSPEGLVVYLPTEAQDALFDNITALSTAGSRLACEFVPDTGIFADERWRTHHERMSELGFDIDFNELVYYFERSHIMEYVARHGWRVSHRTVEQLHADNGFVYPDDEVAAAFADVTYLSAVLQ